MNVIDQNSAATALEKALIPGPSLIDGRTEKERLAFLCQFASLINFYDNTNRVNGNWQPFLLKDPVFLLASISKTDYREEHQLFVKTCANLQALIDKQNSVTPIATDSGIPGEITRLFNQLFDQLTRIFLQIENWTHYMQMGNEEYDLKKYVITQVKENFNAYLWAVLSLRNFLSSAPVLEPQSARQILPVRQYVLDAFTDLIWTKGAGTDPFMQVLGLYSINDVKKIKTGDESGSSGPVPQGIVITTQDYFTGLKNTGDQLFKFYRTIIHHAATEYEKVKNIKSSYPDTLLLRTFTDLLQIHQQELNGIANKHLHFYYSRILKQSEQAAVADSVFITAVTGKNVTVFNLPAGTLFNAGTDAQKNPILFASNEDVSLNAAVITNVFTLAPLTPLITDAPDDGTPDSSFTPDGGADNSILAIAVQSDGKIIVGGTFVLFDGVTVNGIARLNPDGSLDTNFSAATGEGLSSGDQASVIAIQGDGKIIIGGSIKSFNGTTVNNIVRLNTDGTLDNTFNVTLTQNAVVYSISVQHNGNIIIAVAPNNTSPELTAQIFRLNTDGSPDASFTQTGTINNIIRTSVLQSDGKIIIAGNFTVSPGAAGNYIARLNPGGSTDTAFKSDTGANDAIYTCALQTDGRIIIGGDFTKYDNKNASHIARLNADGTLEADFNAAVVNGKVSSCAVQWDGKVIIAGDFTTVAGKPANRIARLLPDGGPDTSFNPGSGADNSILAAALQSDGKILIAGNFMNYDGTSMPRIARVNVLMNPPQLLLQNIATPGAVTTNEAGQALSWETFGGTTNMDTTPAQVKQPGFAFASPMLFLPEGSRQIIIEFRFAELPGPGIFNNAELFLSTQSAWLSVPYYILQADAENAVSIEITLDATQPPIVPFLVNPDGLNSSWAMFKLIFNSFSGLAIPPVLTSVKIDVCVTGVTTFALYNDNGLLSTKTPFQLFGPIVNMNSNFLIGSNEIFSKPLKWLSVELDWDTLPLPPATPVTPAPLDNGFGNYYNSYNTILFPAVSGLTPLAVQQNFSPQKKSLKAEPKKTTPPVNAVKSGAEQTPEKPGKFRRFLKKAWNVIKWPVKIIFYPVRLLINSFSKKKTTPSFSSELQSPAKSGLVLPSFIPPAPPVPGQPVPFANIYFTVEFSTLNYHSWDTFYMYNYGGNAAYNAWLNNPCNGTQVLPDGKPIDFQLFDTSSGNLAAKSVFGYFASVYDTPADLDPAIQNAPLVFDGTNASGFIKMTLTNPANGFGASVYANVVTNIVTQNALKISGSWLLNPVKPSDLVTAPNVPFVPKVKAISAMYGASQEYDLTKASENYPLQFFYYTPFANYTAYDNSPALEKNYSDDKSLVGHCPEIKGLQLVPSFTCNSKTGKEKIFPCSGAMFIGLSGLVPSNAVSFFFELSTTYTAPTAGAEVSYYYLSDKGWKILPLENDGTNKFTCSGIITVNVPADITEKSVAMPAGYWIAIAAAIDPASGTMLDLSSFAQVVLLSPNGIELTRTGTAFLTDTAAPVISALTITKPQTAIPQIGTIVQPFSSFGGKAAENKMQMYERVSNRLKTKDRAVSGNDIFTLIRQQFPDIYFSGAVFSPDTNVTSVYVVEGFDNSAAANAYRPFVSECEIEAIALFLKKRISLFSNITVSNYSFQYIQVIATVSVKPGYVPQAMNGIIADALNIYFSPWIAAANQQQVMIGQPVTGSQVAAFIRGIEGVESVGKIQLLLSGQPLTAAVQTLNPPPGALFVSSLNHKINAVPVK